MALPESPITRQEMYLAKAAGQYVDTPEPITRVEMYLDSIAEKGGGGEVTITVDSDLSSTSENPVQNKVVKAALDDKANVSALSGYALSANVHNIPSGGTAGQFLVKSSATNYDVAWVTVPNANGGSF